jgi:Na+/proline symporter
MLTITFVVYLCFILLIVDLASRKVMNATDFALEGRKGSFILTLSALLATWYGSVTILVRHIEWTWLNLSEK